KYHQRWFHHQGEVRHDAVDVLVKLVAPPPQQAIPVLHRHRGMTQVVVFARSHPDDLGGALEGLPKKRPVPKDFTLQLQGREGAGLRIQQLQIQIARNLTQTALEKATDWTVDR